MARQMKFVSPAQSGTRLRRAILLGLLALTVGTNLGCAKFFHEMKPHRLRRWNYNDSSGRGDALFSINDPLIRSQTPSAGAAPRTGAVVHD